MPSEAENVPRSLKLYGKLVRMMRRKSYCKTSVGRTGFKSLVFDWADYYKYLKINILKYVRRTPFGCV
jgi:hypothetical protein